MKSARISEQAAEMYSNGMAIETVAKELGVAYRTARKAINSKGVELRDPSQRLVGRTRPDKKQVQNA
jgi:orotate phosphoribosyltransferase-like protein